MSTLEFINLEKKFNQTTVLTGVDLAVAAGEFIVLLGPSGCGKSTLLRLLSGLEDPTGGDIRIDGKSVLNTPPQDRGVAMVFQSYALYPHLTVRENLAFPLIVRGVKDAAKHPKVSDVANVLGLTELLDRLPKQLSGGQRQRVAIGRCLVREPEIYLFDEPLSNLDAALRSRMRVELKSLHAKIGKTMLYVTHDQVEAMTLADRVVILHKGVVQQVGTPREVYERPANRFVATFIGTPAMNMIEGQVSGRKFLAPAPIADLPLTDRRVVVGIRPEDITVSDMPAIAGESASASETTVANSESASELGVPAAVEVVEPIGERGYVHLKLGGHSIVASVPGEKAFNYRRGQEIFVRLNADRLHPFDPTTGERISM